jgi:hypothetical protein
MHSRNVNNFAVFIGHLYTLVNEFRTSDMFLSAYIYPPASIIAH